MWYEHLFLVEYGLARFLNAKDVQITEAIAFMSIIRYFESKGKMFGSSILTHF
jgi:hypothetical protein